jgi:hypothetical protein
MAAAPAIAQEPLPPDPAISQYVETMPTASGAKAETSVESGDRAPIDAEATAAEATVPMQVVWLGVAITALTAVALAVARRRRRRM